MRLRTKISLLCFLVTIAVASGCLLISSAYQSRLLLNNEKEQADGRLRLLKTYILNIGWEPIIDGLSDVTKQSVAHYYFAQYGNTVGDTDTGFALEREGRLLFNTCSYDLTRLEKTQPAAADDDDTDEAFWSVFASDPEKRYYLAWDLIEIGSQKYRIYICADITKTGRQIMKLWGISLALIAAAALLALGLAWLSAGILLKPIKTLTDISEDIADGRYDKRICQNTSDELGRLSAAFNTMADAVEEKIRTLTDETERKRLLLGALAHELKTPMTAIIGFSASLLHLPLSAEDRQKCAQNIYQAAGRTERLSQKLMELISLENEAAARLCQFDARLLLSVLPKKQVSLKCTADTIYGDPDLLSSLLSNLAVNARNASRPDQEIEVTVESEANGTRLTVRDWGIGMPEEELGYITEPFYRIDKARSRQRGGAGLGLTLCQMIVNCHQGRMEISSRPGEGTTVTVTLPGPPKAPKL